jgi:hypothetical protein
MNQPIKLLGGSTCGGRYPAVLGRAAGRASSVDTSSGSSRERFTPGDRREAAASITSVSVVEAELENGGTLGD